MNDRSGQDVPTPAGGQAVLLVDHDRDSGRWRLLEAIDSAETTTAVLLVTTSDPRTALDELLRRGRDPGTLGVVDASGTDADLTGIAESATVEGPGSLSALGVAVSDRLERLAHRHDRVIVGLESISDLVTATSVPATFRFLHVLRGRVRVDDAGLLATIDANAHDEEAIRTLAELFDETIGDEAD